MHIWTTYLANSICWANETIAIVGIWEWKLKRNEPNPTHMQSQNGGRETCASYSQCLLGNCEKIHSMRELFCCYFKWRRLYSKYVVRPRFVVKWNWTGWHHNGVNIDFLFYPLAIARGSITTQTPGESILSFRSDGNPSLHRFVSHSLSLALAIDDEDDEHMQIIVFT